MKRNTIYNMSLIILSLMVFFGINVQAQTEEDNNIKETDSVRSINIPFGKINEKYSVGAMNVINPEELSGIYTGQKIMDVLENRVAGLRGNDNLRGLNNALTIVDGSPRPAGNIKVEEVEQVTILKDAQAALMYGPEARNGVILIETKRGRIGKKTVNVYAESGLSVVKRFPEYVNSATYMQLYNEALINDGKEPQFSDSLIALYSSGSDRFKYPDVDYYSDEYLNRQKSFNTITSEFSGGNEDASYYANLGWINEGSLFAVGEGASSRKNQLNFRANIDFNITESISGYIDGSFIYNDDKQPIGDFWSDASTLHPYFYSPLYPYSYIEDNEALANTAEIIHGEYILGGTNKYQRTAYGDLLLGGRQQFIDKNAQFDYGLDFDLGKLTEGLTFNTNLGFDLYSEYTQFVENEYAVYDPKWVISSTGTDSLAEVRKIGEDLVTGTQEIDDNFFYRRYAVSASFDYNRVFNTIHDVSASLVGYYNQRNQQNVVVNRKYAHLGLRANYVYNGKYIINFTGILSNSIKLPEDNRGAFSPSLGLGWVLSEEDFMAGNDMVDFLKLKASGGIMNTDANINDYYLYTSMYGSRGSYTWYDGKYHNVSRYLSRGISSFGYEKVKNINVGIEGRLFNSFGFEANYFNVIESDKLVQRSAYPGYLSNNIPYENYNATSYSGFDLNLVYHQQLTNDLSFDIGGNLLQINSEITQMDEVYEFDYQKREGRPDDLIFGLEATGFFQDSTDVANSVPQSFGEVRPGDLKYKDQNGDGIIDENDAIAIGNSRAEWSYGVHFTLNYKGLSLFVLGGGQAGSNRFFNNDYFWVDGNEKYSEEVLNRWTPETSETATYPRLSSVSNSNNFRNSTFWIRSNNTFNIDQIQLSYDFDKMLADNVNWMKGAELYVRGQSLMTFAKDVEKREIRINNEPAFRHFAVGLKMKF